MNKCFPCRCISVFNSRANDLVWVLSRDEDVLGFRAIGLQARGEQLPGQRGSHGGAEERAGEGKSLDQDGAHGKEIVGIRRLGIATDQDHQVSSRCIATDQNHQVSFRCIATDQNRRISRMW